MQLEALLDKIASVGEPVPAPPSSRFDGAFELPDGRLVARSARVISIASKGYRFDGSDLASYLFRELTKAAI
ncbi:MAG: hypothetical protein HKN46_09405 [Acidimicrobiia bacterium]|nr:hypothetical protein [Acidimicrobiia bacterium]